MADLTGAADRDGRQALVFGAAALALWPFSYAWIPNAGHNPGWILVLVPVAEFGSLAVGLVAVWLGRRAKGAGSVSRATTWGLGLGRTTIVLVVIGFVVSIASYL